MSTPFYVSDSFTHVISDFAAHGVWHTPGPFNMEKTWGQSEAVEAWLEAGEFGFVVYAGPSLEGVNADVWLCLYDLGNVVGGIAQPVLIGGSPVGLYFLTAAGAAMGPANLMNAVAKYGESTRAARPWKSPIRVGGVTTPATGGPFQIGALMRFFGGDGLTLAYQYFLQGYVDGAVPPPPPGTTLLLTMPDGSKWAVPAVAVP